MGKSPDSFVNWNRAHGEPNGLVRIPFFGFLIYNYFKDMI